MTTTTITAVSRSAPRLQSARLTESAGRMYDAEFALHAARQAHVDTWVSAAYGKLHLAIVEHNAALTAASLEFAARTPHAA